MKIGTVRLPCRHWETAPVRLQAAPYEHSNATAGGQRMGTLNGAVRRSPRASISAADSSPLLGTRRRAHRYPASGSVATTRRSTVEDLPRRSAEFLGEPDEKALGPADVAEPIRVFVLDHFAADELRAVLSEPGERLVDVVHSEHDAQVAEGVHRGVPVIGDHTRREKARELEPAAVAVQRAHHGGLDALVAQSSDAPCPLSFHHGSPFELEAELAKELDRRVEVLDDDADVVHPFECHVPNLQWVVNPANGSRGPRWHAPKPREPACRLAYGASGKRAEGQIRARCRTTACIGGTLRCANSWFFGRRHCGSSRRALRAVT